MFAWRRPTTLCRHTSRRWMPMPARLSFCSGSFVGIVQVHGTWPTATPPGRVQVDRTDGSNTTRSLAGFSPAPPQACDALPAGWYAAANVRGAMTRIPARGRASQQTPLPVSAHPAAHRGPYTGGGQRGEQRADSGLGATSNGPRQLIPMASFPRLVPEKLV